MFITDPKQGRKLACIEDLLLISCYTKTVNKHGNAQYLWRCQVYARVSVIHSYFKWGSFSKFILLEAAEQELKIISLMEKIHALPPKKVLIKRNVSLKWNSFIILRITFLKNWKNNWAVNGIILIFLVVCPYNGGKSGIGVRRPAFIT